mmetsp:Transcript_8400/g.33149  ORF Transcript_8400/g.33149 Transcript_8400/m.33149 type:complete len:281 (-) Transcript_8400:1265-2107(-)
MRPMPPRRACCSSMASPLTSVTSFPSTSRLMTASGRASPASPSAAPARRRLSSSTSSPSSARRSASLRLCTARWASSRTTGSSSLSTSGSSGVTAALSRRMPMKPPQPWATFQPSGRGRAVCISGTQCQLVPAGASGSVTGRTAGSVGGRLLRRGTLTSRLMRRFPKVPGRGASTGLRGFTARACAEASVERRRPDVGAVTAPSSPARTSALAALGSAPTCSARPSSAILRCARVRRTLEMSRRRASASTASASAKALRSSASIAGPQSSSSNSESVSAS